MNGGLERNAVLLAGLAACGNREGVDVVVCPPYPYLAQAVAALRGAAVAVGGQDLCAFKDGAYTGEVSASMLLDIGCAWVIVGHSERRSLFGETDAVTAAKVLAALDAGLSPILCVGESLAQREAGDAEVVVRAQLDRVVDVLGAERFAGVVVAYEPVWAIGTGKTATPDDAQEVCKALRAAIAEKYGAEVGEAVRIQYGGSVKPDNAAEILSQPDVDGALVGGASLKALDFTGIIQGAIR